MKKVEIGEDDSEIEVSIDRIIEEGHNMLILIEMTLGEENLEECKIIGVKILEVDMEVITEMKTLEEVEVGLGKGNIQVILEGMIEAIAVCQDQVLEQVLTEIGLVILNLGNMIISLRTVQIQKNRKRARTDTTNI